VGPAAPSFAVTAERLTPAPWGGVVRLIVRAAAKRLAGLPGAWEAGFAAARADLWARRA
jgi:hypothetical protein